LKEKDFADGTKQTYTYDSHGNLLTATDASGTITFSYGDPNNSDLITEVAYPDGHSLSFQYNSVGQRTQSVDDSGFTIHYQYDALGRLQKLLDGNNNLIVQYTYDPAGQLIQKDMGNGTRTTYQYDSAGNLLRLTNLAPDHATVNSEYDYTYDALGRVITMTTGGMLTTYGYDADGQLVSITAPGLSIQYFYDAAGNRISETNNGVTTAYSANNINEYTTVGGTTYQYDADGNLVSKTDASGTTTYNYNDENRLTGAMGPGLSTAYTCDALGSV
jgi:YD repeat-containing protein